MFKHPENTMAVNPKTLDFSVFSQFSVGTTVLAKQKRRDQRSVIPQMKSDLKLAVLGAQQYAVNWS
jgi:hypothetical protein